MTLFSRSSWTFVAVVIGAHFDIFGALGFLFGDLRLLYRGSPRCLALEQFPEMLYRNVFGIRQPLNRAIAYVFPHDFEMLECEDLVLQTENHMMIIDGLMFYVVVGGGAFVDWTRKREDRLRTVWFCG